MSQETIRNRSNKGGLKTIGELCSAAKCSARGFWAVLLGEKAFRTDVVIFLVCLLIACMLPQISFGERALLIYSAFFPLVAELINTAVERTIDRISLDYHELSGLVKDIGSAVVLFAFVGAGLCWFVILLGLCLRLIKDWA